MTGSSLPDGVCRLATLFVLGLALAPAGIRAADADVTLRTREQRSNVFADQEAAFEFVVEAAKPWKGRLGWAFTSAAGRTFARGEAALTADAARPGSAKVRVRVPPVKPGVVLEARLAAAAYPDGGRLAAATWERRLWVFFPEPFAGREEWFKNLKVTLFDPAETTTGILKKRDLPFSLARDADSLRHVKEGLLLVGEGVSFREEPGLAEALLEAAARGLPVLCLAAAEGALPLPGDGAGPAAPSGLVFRRQDAIRRLDKRLDAESWAGADSPVRSRLALRADGADVVAEINPKDGWPWAEVAFPRGNGRLVYCGFGVIRSWDAGPAPRYLFAGMLESLVEKAAPPTAPERTPEP